MSTQHAVVGTDGTPNESPADVVVRVRQVLSICETQYSGDTVVFVAADSQVLSILEAVATGLDLTSHWKLAYLPGEVRLLVLDRAVKRSESSASYKCLTPPSCM